MLYHCSTVRRPVTVRVLTFAAQYGGLACNMTGDCAAGAAYGNLLECSSGVCLCNTRLSHYVYEYSDMGNQYTFSCQSKLLDISVGVWNVILVPVIVLFYLPFLQFTCAGVLLADSFDVKSPFCYTVSLLISRFIALVFYEILITFIIVTLILY